MSDMYKLIFPDAKLVNQNAKRQEIWLKVRKRYPTITSGSNRWFSNW